MQHRSPRQLTKQGFPPAPVLLKIIIVQQNSPL